MSEPSASEPLRRFLQVARGAGLRISAAEGIDAARAVDLVGYADREILKEVAEKVEPAKDAALSLIAEKISYRLLAAARRSRFTSSTSRTRRSSTSRP